MASMTYAYITGRNEAGEQIIAAVDPNGPPGRNGAIARSRQAAELAPFSSIDDASAAIERLLGPQQNGDVE